ncbi:MAG TPA: four helix bundle protein [Candidatus Omnitrophica bacterium]|nr:four helix bundle protein [Candidatus Omnitrophota bacterium]
MALQSHKELLVWQKSMDLVENIYKITQLFPREELYGLTSQIRRAAVAIPTNITEGYQRNHKKEYIQFLYIAKSSASELETLLNISERLNLNLAPGFTNTKSLLTEILKMLTALISKLKSSITIP